VRAMLLHAEGLFRLDVTIDGDTVKTVVRNLSPGELDTTRRTADLGGASIGFGDVGTYEPGRVEFEFALGRGSDRIAVTGVIATLRFKERGTIRVTAQAVARPAPAR
jgi:hypothetical protein